MKRVQLGPDKDDWIDTDSEWSGSPVNAKCGNCGSHRIREDGASGSHNNYRIWCAKCGTSQI